MKRTLITTTVLALLLGCATVSTQAVTGETSKRGSISVNTSANTEIAPDIAEISFAVQTSDTKSMQKATLENKQISEQVFSQLKAMINTENGDYIKTSDFNAAPIYSYNGSKRSFEKYEVSNRVIVHTKSIDKVGKMIDNAISAGATNVDSLNFSVSNYENQCNDLIKIAAQKAKTRADVLAGAMGTSVLGINSVTTSCNANNSQSRLYMAKNMLADTAEAVSGAGTTISNGVVKIYANVNASFFVK